MSSNFDEYVVFLPDEHDGIDYGCKDPVRVLALDEKDAVRKAIEEWWGGSLSREGTAIVALVKHLNAYVLGEIRGIEIVAETSLPTKPREDAKA